MPDKPEHDLWNFSGQPFQVMEVDSAPKDRRRGSPKGVTVLAEARQADQDFLEFCRNAPQDTIVTTRRLLFSNGIIVIPDGDIVVDGDILQMRARLVPIVGKELTDNILSRIRPGMYVGKPNHFNGFEPINLDRLNLARRSNYVQFPGDSVRVSRSQPKTLADAKVFTATGEVGDLHYFPTDNKRFLGDVVHNRLHHRPEQVGSHWDPHWRPRGIEPQDANELAALRMRLQAGFHTLVFGTATSAGENQATIINSPAHAPQYIFSQNTSGGLQEMNQVDFQMYDRRKEAKIFPTNIQERAVYVLSEGFAAADELFEHLAARAHQRPEMRPAALVVNKEGIDAIQAGDNAWVCTNENLTDGEQERLSRDDVETTFLETPSDIVQQGRETPVIRLLERGRERGMDPRAAIATVTFPPHAALNVLNANEAEWFRQFDALIFRHASLMQQNGETQHGEYFSQNDFTGMRDLAMKGVDVYWAHQGISHQQDDDLEWGTLLKLVELRREIKGQKKSSSLVFVPPEREQEFLNGVHIAFYGTARVMQEKYAKFMENLFKILPQIRQRETTEQQTERKYVFHTGGGPDESTMGVGNRLAREHRHLSVGHALGVKREPRARGLDAIMPFRNDARDIRQGNMGKAADIVFCMEGGSGTREERGISLTDLNLVRAQAFPIVLVGVDFYLEEYLQYLKEVAVGTLDENVLDSISVIESPEDGARVVDEFVNNDQVVSVLPQRLSSGQQQRVDTFAANVLSVSTPGISLPELCQTARRMHGDSIGERRKVSGTNVGVAN